LPIAIHAEMHPYRATIRQSQELMLSLSLHEFDARAAQLSKGR
jgi:hypothetical protein